MEVTAAVGLVGGLLALDCRRKEDSLVC